MQARAATETCGQPRPLLSSPPEPKHLEQTPSAFVAALRMGTISMDHGNLVRGFGGWGSVGSWESAATESELLRGHFQSECQSCHLLLPPLRCLSTRSRAAYGLPAGKGLSFPTFPKRGGRMANFTPPCQASSQHTSTASCPSAPVPSHPPPSSPSDVAIKTSVAVKRLMCVGGGGGGERSGSHEPGPRLLQPP